MNTPPRILIVDDEPYNVDYLQQELSDRNFELIAASNGQEALKKIRAASPDLVLLDIMMPVMDGFAVLEQVKADAATRDIPVIVISASNDLKSVVKGIQHGAEDYLPKPFEPVLLHARISASLDRKRLRDQEQLYLKGLERELEIGREIQEGFLPAELPRAEGWEIAAYFKAAREVAGDFYDAFHLPDGTIGLVIADVCDKGVGAALFMTLFRSLIRAAATAEFFTRETAAQDPIAARLERSISLANDYIAKTHGRTGMFATVFFGILDPKSGLLTYVNAGHEPPVIVRADGAQTRLPKTGLAVGLLAGFKFTQKTHQFESGDLFFAFTDGAPECKNPRGEFFEREPLLALLDPKTESAGTLLLDIESRLREHIAEAVQFDDITMLAVRRLR
ncbi:response regulator [Chloroflexi bacterium CFX6]|nr:response regulator [Chloroflexi bacterium CFX6]